jgi:hypothetical protein
MDYANFEHYWQRFLGGQGPAGAYFAVAARAAVADGIGGAVRAKVP